MTATNEPSLRPTVSPPSAPASILESEHNVRRRSSLQTKRRRKAIVNYYHRDGGYVVLPFLGIDNLRAVQPFRRLRRWVVTIINSDAWNLEAYRCTVILSEGDYLRSSCITHPKTVSGVNQWYPVSVE